MACDESFRRKITQQEGVLFDRKAYVELWDDRRKASFIKDILALANTSRCTGKESELVMGVDDEGNIKGISEMTNRFGNLDAVRRFLTSSILRYIQPDLELVDVQSIDCDGHTILSIKIPPLPTETPFKVRRNLDCIKTGQSWIRTGESNTELTPDIERFYLPYTKCPYIFPEQWRDYFIDLQERFSHSYTIEGYQELLSSHGKEIVEEIREFLEDDKKLLVLKGEAAIGKTTILERFAFSQAELLEGDIHNRENFYEMYYPIGYIPIFVSLRDIRIQEVSEMETLLVNRLCEGMKFQDRRPAELNRLFENTKNKFGVLLDGFDEILNDDAKRQFIRVLEDVMGRYPDLKFILTTRPPSPSFTNEHRNKISEVKIQPFNAEQMRKYIEFHCDRETLEKVEAVIYSDTELTQICSIPFYLETALPEIIGEFPAKEENGEQEYEQIQVTQEESENDFQRGGDLPIEPALADELILDQPIGGMQKAPTLDEPVIQPPAIRIGAMLDRIYWKAWIRETYKKNYHPETTRDFWSQTEKLAINVNLGEEIGHHQFNRVMRRKARMFCLSLSVLTETEERRRVRFFTDLTQVIFAANYLKELIQENRTRFENQIQGLSTQFRDKLTPILMDISPKFYTLNTQEE